MQHDDNFPGLCRCISFPCKCGVIQALRDLGIKHDVVQSWGITYVQVDRTSMIQASPGVGEDAAYRVVLNILKEVAGPKVHVMWDGRTDDWLGVGVYRRRPVTMI